MKIKKNDNVVVIAGKDKGRTGTVSRVFPKTGLVVVGGLNVYKKHQRPRKGGEKGAIVEKVMPVHVSNVMLRDSDGKPTRAGRKLIGDKWMRVSKRTGKEI